MLLLDLKVELRPDREMSDKNQKNQYSNPPTMHDVAHVAGVSQMTVSRVMRGTGYVSNDVLKRVQDAARSIGYVHNRLAGGMSKYDNPLIGVVVPSLQNRVFTEVLSGISDTLNNNNLRPVFGVSEYSLEREEEIVFDLLYMFSVTTESPSGFMRLSLISIVFGRKKIWIGNERGSVQRLATS